MSKKKHLFPKGKNNKQSVNTKKIYQIDGKSFSLEFHEPKRGVPDKVPEKLVQQLWARLDFDWRRLKTTDGRTVKLLDRGRLNTNEGPDFLGARIQLDGLEVNGDIEIHCRSRSWFDHKHHLDPNYNAVILTVTLFPDLWTGKLYTESLHILPELQLVNYLRKPLTSLIYSFYMDKTTILPCATSSSRISIHSKQSALDSYSMAQFSARLRQLQGSFQKNPEPLFLLQQLLYEGMGYGPNKNAMKLLAQKTPLYLCLQYDDRLSLEALHLGAAGFLSMKTNREGMDIESREYVSTLQNRFAAIQQKHPIESMPADAWHTFRMRPVNFPTFRIAQLVSWLLPGGFLRDGILQLSDGPFGADFVPVLQEMLGVQLSSFWKSHYHFYSRTHSPTPGLGINRINKLIANGILPYLVMVSEISDLPWPIHDIKHILDALPAEDDSITRQYEVLGIIPQTMSESQALHYLHSELCSTAGCLNCPIGKQLFNIP